MPEREAQSSAAFLTRRSIVATIEAPTRHDVKSFPPLLEDTRENHLIKSEGDKIDIYAKPVAGPYTGREGNHFLIVPDAKNGRNLPTVQDLTARDLGFTLELAEAFAYQTLEEKGIVEVDFGFHSSRADQGKPKQKNNTFPDHLHIHVTGYSEGELTPIPAEEIAKNPDLIGKTGEALHFLTEELFMNEILPEIKEFTDFDTFFTETRDQKGRLRFSMGNNFTGHSEGIAEVIQSIDAKAKKVYDDVAHCFFKVDEHDGSYVEKADDYKRYELLPADERQEKLAAYLEDRPYLSRGAKVGLRLLSHFAQDADVIMERELAKDAPVIQKETTDYRSGTPEQQAANRFFAYKDLAYTMVWSAKKNKDADVEWLFGFDPMIFTVEGVPQSSAFTDKIILKQEESFTKDELAAVRAREERIVDAVLLEEPFAERGKRPSEI